MSAPATTVELVTASGQHITLDRRGWRCQSQALRERLEREVPLDALHDDPLRAAAEVACIRFDARIVQMRRARLLQDLIATCQMLTESALQRVLLIAEDVEHHQTTAQHRQLRWNRLAMVGLALAALALGIAALVYLTR